MSTFYLTKEMTSEEVAKITARNGGKRYLKQIKEVIDSIKQDKTTSVVAENLYFLYLSSYNDNCGIPFLQFPQVDKINPHGFIKQMLKSFVDWLKISDQQDEIPVVNNYIASITDRGEKLLPSGNWIDYIGNRNRYETVKLQKAVSEMTQICVRYWDYYGMKKLDKKLSSSLYKDILVFCQNRVRESLIFQMSEDFWETEKCPDRSVIEEFYGWARIISPAPTSGKEYPRDFVFLSTYDKGEITKAFRQYL